MRRLLLAWMLALSLHGCSEDSTRSLMDSARINLEKKNHNVAIAELKSVLQQEPNNADARFLLGKAFFDSGEDAQAELELGRAKDLGYPDDQTVPIFAKAMLRRGDFKGIVERYSRVELTTPAAAASLKTSVAIAFLRQGQTENAAGALTEALRSDPKSGLARVWQSILMASKGDVDQALANLDETLADDPANLEAWQAKGEVLLTSKSDRKGAEFAFRKAIEIDRKYIPAYAALINSALNARDLPGMLAHVEELKSAVPKNPNTYYFEAQAAFLKGDYPKATEMTQQLLKAAPSNVRLLQLSGAIQVALKAPTQAVVFFSKALSLDPGYSPARRSLAKTYLKSGQPERALAVLKPLLEVREADVDAVSSAAEAYLQLGNIIKSEEYFSKAAAARPTDPRFPAALALLNLARGNADQAFGELNAIASKDQSGYSDMALVTARLRRREYDAALVSLDNMAKKQARQAHVENLRGRILLAKNDRTGARKSFEFALSIDPAYYPATAELLLLDVQENAAETARKRLASVLQTDPNNYRAMLAMAELMVASGAKREEIEALVRKAIQANPMEAAPRLAMIRFYLARHNAKAALAEAQLAMAAIPADTGLLDALGQAQIAASELQQARSTYAKLAAAVPRSPMPHLRMADLHLATGDYKASAASLQKALDVAPENLAALRGLISLQLREKRYDDALKIARKVQAQRPKDEVGFVLEGDIEAKRSRWDAAIAAYRSGLQKAQTAELAAKIHKMQLNAGRPQDAEKLAASWERDHPDDVAFLFYIGDFYMSKREFAAAELKYRAVSKQRPDHSLALNNTAFAMLKQGKSGALELAEKANQIAPNVPDVMDTLALALLAENQPTKALELQRRAVELSPENNTLRLTLAKALLQSGDRTGAKAELERLRALGTGFSGSKEIETLLASL